MTTGDSNTPGGNSDDLLSQLLDLGDPPANKDKSDKPKQKEDLFGKDTPVPFSEEEKTEFINSPFGDGGHTEVIQKDSPSSEEDVSNKTEVISKDLKDDLSDFLVEDSNDDVSSKTDVVMKTTGNAEVGTSTGERQSLDDLVGFDSPSVIVDDATSDGDDALDTLLGEAAGHDELMEGLSDNSPVSEDLEDTIFESPLSSGEFPTGEREKTIVLDSPLEPSDEDENLEPAEAADFLSHPDLGETASSGEKKALDPIEEALAEFIGSDDQEASPGLDANEPLDVDPIIEEAAAPEAAEDAPAPRSADDEILDLFDAENISGGRGSEKEAASSASKELSDKDFADVFQSGPIQVPGNSDTSKEEMSGKRKQILLLAASAFALCGLVVGTFFVLQSESGLLGYRLEGLAFEKVYREPSQELQQEFRKVFEAAQAAGDLDDPAGMANSIEPLASILVQDERNFEAAAVQLEFIGRLMHWEGLAGAYPARFDQVKLQIDQMLPKLKREVNQAPVFRAKAWRSLAAGDLRSSLAVLETDLKSVKTWEDDTFLLLSELSFRTGDDQKSKAFLDKVKSIKLRRAKFMRALLNKDNRAMSALARDNYLPAEIELLLMEEAVKETARADLAKANRLNDKVKGYPWLQVRVQERVGDLQFALGDGEKAREEWSEIVEAHPSETRVWEKLASSYEKDLQWADAINAYQSALKAGGFNRRLALSFVRLLRNQLKIVEALEIIEQALAKNPKDAVFHYEKGETQLSIYQEEAAKVSFERALEIKPDYEPAILSLAKIAMAQRNWAEAEKSLNAIKPESSNFAEALVGLGRLSLERYDTNSAQKFFARAIKQDNKNEEAYSSLTELLLRKEEDKKAMALISQAKELMPKSGLVRAQLARVLSFQGKSSEAFDEIAPALKTHGHLLQIKLIYANLLISKQDFVKANATLDQLMGENLDNTEIQYLKAKAIMMEAEELGSSAGSPESAWRHIQSALQRRPDDEEYLIMKAKISRALEERLQAFESVERVIKLYPDSAKAYVLEGDLHTDSSSLAEALRSYEKALRYTRFKGEIYQRIAKTYRQRGDVDKAIQYYQIVAKWFPSDAMAYLELGKLYNEKGLYAKALSNLKRSAQLRPNLAEAYYYLGFIQKEIGEPGPAIQNFERYLSLDPRGVEAATVRDEVYFMKGGTQN